jgi:quercetin dioxygenase-like cupin family protein
LASEGCDVHSVESVDWSFGDAAPGYDGHAEGLARRLLVGRSTGATHTELAVDRLAPGGWVDGHVHSFEKAVYVLAGEPVLALGPRKLLLRAGDYALLPVGFRHSWANPGTDEARWLAASTPQRIPTEEDRRDTFFRPGDDDARTGGAAPPTWGDPTSRFVGHYEGTPPQAEVLQLDDPARGRRPAGMDTALLAYSGISVKMLVDRNFGAELLTVFTVDYEPNGAAQVHDHPFEEAYFFVGGEIDAVLDGREYRIRAGDVVFASVGSTHGFFNNGPGRVRWIETQAPQPPARHSYRWADTWKKFESEGG